MGHGFLSFDEMELSIQNSDIINHCQTADWTAENSSWSNEYAYGHVSKCRRCQLIGIEKRYKLGFETFWTLDCHGVPNFETYPHNYRNIMNPRRNSTWFPRSLAFRGTQTIPDSTSRIVVATKENTHTQIYIYIYIIIYLHIHNFNMFDYIGGVDLIL